ncbi:hypothetical protein IC575_012249 [Cucumis melo]
MALRQRGINVFIDNKISRGEEISASLLEAIEEPKIFIVIISENYASSRWCLNELKVDPSQVRIQSGRFGEEFAKLEVRFFNEMQAWREMTNSDFLETMIHVAPLLKKLDLSRNNFCRLPSCITNFKSLERLSTRDCKLLEKIPKVPEGVVCMNARGCISLVRFPNNIPDFISCNDNVIGFCLDGVIKELILMNCDIPDWYRYTSMNNSITFLLPADHLSWKRGAFSSPCVKFEVTNDALQETWVLPTHKYVGENAKYVGKGYPDVQNGVGKNVKRNASREAFPTPYQIGVGKAFPTSGDASPSTASGKPYSQRRLCRRISRRRENLFSNVFFPT